MDEHQHSHHEHHEHHEPHYEGHHGGARKTPAWAVFAVVAIFGIIVGYFAHAALSPQAACPGTNSTCAAASATPSGLTLAQLAQLKSDMSDYLSTLILINGAPAGVTVQVNDVSANGTMYRASYDIMQDGQVAQSGFGFVTNDGKRLFLGNYMDLTQKLEMPTPKPAIDINVSGRPYRGAENATVTIVEFADFQCPYCKLAGANVEGVLSTYSGSVKYYLVHFPLSMHQNAQKASEAFECAMLQGEAEGWALYDTMFAKGAGDGTGLAVADLKAYAQNLSLDAAKFNKCLDDNQTAAKVLADASYGAQLGVSGTPTFFVNGKEAVGGAAMQSAVEAILKK